MTSIKISELIAPSFYKLHKEIKREQWGEVWCKGGRGSTKSSFLSIEIILGMLKDKDANATAGRRFDNELHDSVFNQLLWAIEKLGVDKEFRHTVAPLRIIRKSTGQMIIFKGADNPKKTKSLKLVRGYIKYVWLEEVDQYAGPEEIRTLLQSYFRGTNKNQIAMFSYNPPKSARSWVNQEVKIPKKGRRVHHSDYRSVPAEWLGDRFIAEAEHLKETNDMAYRHEYLGEEVGTGLEVFDNVEIRTITDQEIAQYDKIRQGLDFGFAVDPLVWNRMHLEKKRLKLCIFKEISGRGMQNRAFAAMLNEQEKRELTIADSAEPKSIAELHSDYGINITGAKKGPGSVDHGIKWLSDLNQIVIDPVRCHLAAKEFTNYSLEINRQGDVISRYPDKDNHTIDGVRYALEYDMIGSRSMSAGAQAIPGL